MVSITATITQIVQLITFSPLIKTRDSHKNTRTLDETKKH